MKTNNSINIKKLDNDKLNTKLMKKKYKYIFGKVEKKIDKIRTIFFNLRSIMNTGGYTHESLAKKYKGIVKSGTENDNGGIIQFVRVFDKKDTDKIKYEIKYGIKGISVKVGDEIYCNGIHYIRFADFDCKKVKEVIYNYHVPDRIEIYKMYMSDDDAIKVKFSFIEKEDKSWVGKLWSFLRIRKYIY